MNPRRIVSLCPSTTETLIDLGVGDRLIGITRFCIHPADAVASIKKVGGTKDPDLDAIRALAPDLVFMNSEENRAADHAALARDLAVDVTEPRTITDVPALLRHFGACVGAASAAAARADALEQQIADLDRYVAVCRAAGAKPFRFAYLIWKKPWMAVGPATYVDDLLTRAGGLNVFAQDSDVGPVRDPASRYPTFDIDALAARAADVVLLPDEPFPFSDTHRPEVAAAAPAAHVELISGDDACWHGVRSLRGAALALRLAQRWLVPPT